MNFDPPVCTALREVATQGYPSQASLRFLRSNSVASYMGQVRVPTLIGQGQADTLFNLQESVATYTALKRQGTPVALVWQSWGHSDSSPQPGELNLRHPEQSLQGRQALAWFDFYVRGVGTRAAAELPVLPGLGLRGDRQHPAGLRDGAVLPGRQHADDVPVRAGRAGSGRPSGRQSIRRRPWDHRVHQPRADRSQLHRDVRGRPELRAGHRPAGHRDPLRHRPAAQRGDRRRLPPADRAVGRAHGLGPEPGHAAGGLREALRPRAGRGGRRTAPTG